MTAPTKFYLFRRDNGIYYVAYFHEGRKLWKSTRCSRKQDALKAVSNLSDLFREERPPVSLAAFAAQFLTHARAMYAPGNVVQYDLALRNLRQVCGDRPLAAFSAKDVDTFKSERMRGVSPVSVNRELRTLRAAFNVAVRWNLLEVNPFAGVQLVPVPEVPPAYFKRSDFERLLAVIQAGWLRELVVFAALTGMRRGEILNLRWKNVDLTRKVISIQTGAGFRVKAGKCRTVPMSEAAHLLLSSKAKRSTCEYVFHRRGHRFNGDYVQKRFRHYCDNAKLPDKMNFRALRATFASWLVQSGAPILAVSKLLGHSDVRITQKHYAHLAPEQLFNEVNRIDVPFS